MIPTRLRAHLPVGHWWIVRERRGRLVVILSALVPIDSALEDQLVRDAARAWRRHRRKTRVLPIAGATELVARQARRPVTAAGAAVVTASLVIAGGVAVTQVQPQHSPVYRASSPPAQPGPAARLPGKPSRSSPPRRAVPGRPSTPVQVVRDHHDKTPTLASPRMLPVGWQVRLPVRRLHVRPPHMPVKVPRVPVRIPAVRRRRLVDVRVGRLLHLFL